MYSNIDIILCGGFILTLSISIEKFDFTCGYYEQVIVIYESKCIQEH